MRYAWPDLQIGPFLDGCMKINVNDGLLLRRQFTSGYSFTQVNHLSLQFELDRGA